MTVRSLAALTLILIVAGCASNASRLARQAPPEPREMRAAWVATVANIDWPSSRDLSVEQQQREAIAILDEAKRLHLNAIIFQVRPAADALYASQYEPWSVYLTGAAGAAPEPFYDPLQFWVEQAHARGLELHAWFNPYRARHPSDRSEKPANAVATLRPDLVRVYGEYEWLDPGEPEAADHSIRVMLDVVQRYDVDGIHIDDYFYPYPIGDQAFPDDASWQKYVAGGGTLSRDDWRRDNIDRFVKRMYVETKRLKPHVRVGISPFGIWQPGHPAGIQGFNAREKLYADAKLWLNEGWVDYFTPQLYWPIAPPAQSYTALLDWWIAENPRGRHIWPGHAAYRVTDARRGWTTQELLDQIQATRDRPGAGGDVHFSFKALQNNVGGVADALLAGPYAAPALPPATPWLGGRAPATPRLEASADGARVRLPRGDAPWLWAVHRRVNGQWTFDVVPGRAETLPRDGADAMVVSAVNELGVASRRAAIAF